MEEKDFLLAISQCNKIGPSRLKRLRAYFFSWQKAWEAPVSALQKAGLDNAAISELIYFRKNFKIEIFKKSLTEENIQTLSVDESNYPALLKQIYLPPPILYYQGILTTDFFSQPTISIVGSRRPSAYGKQIVERLVRDLAKINFIIISGLALGIDELVHNITLEEKGKTIAVLGSGLNNIYPSCNKLLAEKISQSGCLISEFPPDTPPFKGNFPQRNRIIAGLAQATLLIEASEKSGSLITAHYALQENREVMAIPGNIYSPMSRGTNNLIKDGAALITETKDILKILKFEDVQEKIPVKETVTLSPEETLILKFLSHEPKHINEITQNTKLDMGLINSRLTIMELKGLVKNTGNMSYIRLF